MFAFLQQLQQMSEGCDGSGGKETGVPNWCPQLAFEFVSLHTCSWGFSEIKCDSFLATVDLEQELSCMGMCKMQDSYGLVLLEYYGAPFMCSSL